MTFKSLVGISLVGIVTILPSVALAASVDLMVNGTFETGDLTGWTVLSHAASQGTYVVDDTDPFTPLSGLPTVGPAGGAFYALSDSVGPGAQVIYQDFSAPVGATLVSLSFDMFVNNWNGGAPVIGKGFDYLGSSNQHARVELLKNTAEPFSSDVVTSFFVGADSNVDETPPHEYKHYTFDITSIVNSGEVFRLRFGEVDNLLFLNQGIDNVSIRVGAQPMPTPSSAALLLMGFLAFGWTCRIMKIGLVGA
jgi:hypothetical protein